ISSPNRFVKSLYASLLTIASLVILFFCQERIRYFTRRHAVAGITFELTGAERQRGNQKPSFWRPVD
ncbi:MAG TPA: hypothetical protein PKI72_15530, partial [Giesbergeria sp.]|nr:hypothetical protein [Giesbergeria sp.]